MDRNPNSPEFLKQQRKAVGRLNALRTSSTREAYLGRLVEASEAQGLGYNRARAVAWRDMVLGGDDAPARVGGVPHICKRVIVKSRATGAAGAPSTPARRPRTDSAGGGGTGSSGGDSPADSATDSFASCVSAASSSPAAEAALPANCQPRVMEADLLRSLWTLYPDDATRTVMRLRLKDVLLRVLACHPDRHYYQGLHELVGFVMYVVSPALEAEVVVALCEGLLLTRWRCFTEATLAATQAQLYAVHAVIARADSALAAELERTGLAPESHYAVPWVITWYVHTVDAPDAVARLFDFFIAAADGRNVLFFTAALMVAERERVLGWIAAARAELEGTPMAGDDLVCMARVYASLTHLPREILPKATDEYLNRLVADAVALRGRYAEIVDDACADFLAGKVKKLGMLADHRTRNAALRLLRKLLLREWRNPLPPHRATQLVAFVTAGALTVATALAVAKLNGST